MSKVGYARVSSTGQNTERQLDGITLDRRFEEKASGKNMERPELLAMLAYVREGDEVLVHSLDRLGRNLADLLKLVEALVKRGIKVSFVKEALTFSGDDNAMSMLTLSMLGAFAAFERSLLLERQKEGIAIAKAKGAYRGRKPSLSAAQVAEIKSQAAAGVSKAKLATDYGVSRETIYALFRAKV